jgi:hypothetical protein
MNNFFKALFIIWLLSLIFAVAVRADSTPPFKEISSARPQLIITYTPSIQEIEDIALLVAQTTPYDVWKYNCWDYATDLKLELAKNGYDSRIIFGIVDCSSGTKDIQVYWDCKPNLYCTKQEWVRNVNPDGTPAIIEASGFSGGLGDPCAPSCLFGNHLCLHGC